MIINTPKSTDFERIANTCLVQAFNIIFESDKQIGDNYDLSLREHVWKYSQEKLNTAVVLIHQGIEAFMKASICHTTPLLLIESKRTDWPVLPNQRDKEFNDFYTLSAESLLHTFFATIQQRTNELLINHIQEIRKVRNQIVHGISSTELTSSYLVEKILDTYLFFKAKDRWWGEQLASYFNHPLTGFHDLSTEAAQLAERLDYVLGSIGKAKMTIYFSVNLKGRSYFCPKCLKNYERGAALEYSSKWAFLTPNTKEAHVVTCINCTEQHIVIRQPCPHDYCKGNVLFRIPEDDSGFCLTCKDDIYWYSEESIIESENADNNQNNETE
jgi:hypothetical protein